MSVLQSTQNEVRYLKRKALEEESRIIGNALRDQIRQYGIDCVYYKMDTKDFTNFKNIIDQNTILKRAYGYNITPNYTMSAHMITYADVQQDIFLLNKIGMNPNVEIDFNFDRIDFACALATKCGQFKEYKIKKTEYICEIPDSIELSSQPYFIGISSISHPQYYCDMLSGSFRAEISSYEYLSGENFTDEITIICDPYEHTSFNVSFPVNDDLYRSLKYTIENDDYLETLLKLTYRINRIKVNSNSYKNILSGYVHGSILFYDIDALGKYVEMIHPSVGDIVEIDFPDDKNREKYEITDCYDKQLTQDGINPLLHKYIWKCKAKRYINSFEDNTPQSEADDRVEEMNKYDMLIDDQVAEAVSKYDQLTSYVISSSVEGLSTMYDNIISSREVKEDSVYGGYDGVIDQYDKQAPTPYYEKYDFIDDGTAVDLIRFASGSRLVTDGYVLIFMNRHGDFYQITTNSFNLPNNSCIFEQNLRWLKATDSEVVFVNVEGESTAIACDIVATQGQLEFCLNSLFDKSLDDGKPLNENDQNYYKFKGTRTYMWSDGDHLYVKLASNHQLYQIDGKIDKF